jgi:hypothetical protein
MVLTVRQRGQLLLAHSDQPVDDVVATVWFDQTEDGFRWGGIVEPQVAAPILQAQVLAGQVRYRLQLEDGRTGAVELSLSEFEADGQRPLTFAGIGRLARMGARHG